MSVELVPVAYPGEPAPVLVSIRRRPYGAFTYGFPDDGAIVEAPDDYPNREAAISAAKSFISECAKSRIPANENQIQ